MVMYWKDHWSYTKCIDTLRAMVNAKRHQFLCGFPYQLSISEGLLDADQVADEMAESDFSDIKFSMEMGAEFYGSDEGAFFDFSSISKNRKIKYPMLPDYVADKVNNSQYVKIPPKQNGEIRILSADIALMSSTKHNNDATAIFVNQLVKTKSGRYISNIVYSTAYEGLRTDDQALEIRKLFDEFMCDNIVLDTSGEPLPLCVVTCRAKCGRNGKAEMLIRVEGYRQRYSHTQRIDTEPALQNIMCPRVRTIWIQIKRYAELTGSKL